MNEMRVKNKRLKTVARYWLRNMLIALAVVFIYPLVKGEGVFDLLRVLSFLGILQVILFTILCAFGELGIDVCMEKTSHKEAPEDEQMKPENFLEQNTQ